MDLQLTNPYRSEVLVGTWLEDQTLHKAKTDKFKEEYERGVTKLQNTRRMKANLLKEVSLALPDSLVRLGAVVQLVAPDMPAFMLTGQRGHFGLVLSGYVDDVQVDHCQFLAEDSRLLGSPSTQSCARNSWRLCAEDGSRRLDGCPLQFGQCFTLAAVEAGSSCPLYVRAKCNTVNEVGCGPPRLQLSTRCDTYCRWRVLHQDVSRRPETLGCAFPPNMRVVISHAASNLNLSVSAGGKRVWVPTFFGPECLVGLNIYKDIHGQVTAENVWMLRSAVLRDPSTELTCPAPELQPVPRPPPPPAPPTRAPCPTERVCPLSTPEQRKTPCPADMPCQRDLNSSARPPPPSGCPAARAPSPSAPPCPRNCTCDARPPCLPAKRCLRLEELQASPCSSWQRFR